MSTSTQSPSRGHRHTRNAAKSSSAASSQYLQNRPNSHASLQNSENERSISSVNQISHPATPPRTPRKDNQTPVPSSSTANQNGSKQRSRNKNRQKNVTTSPAVARNNRKTPPLTSTQTSGAPTAKSMNTPSTTAYAGPTFHASPAPSALPIPSFYSKSVPDSPGAKKLKSSLKDDLSTTPITATVNKSQFLREESPLDFFFKADREEKARAGSASSAQAPSVPGPFHPPGEATRSNQTPPFPSSQSRTRPRHKARMSSSGMFAMELDGESDPGTPYGPAFSTPYAQRISAAKSAASSTKSLPQPSELQKSTERSEALKAYLFSGHSISPPAVNNISVAPSSSPSTSSNEYPTSSSPAGLRSFGMNSRSSSYFSQIYGSDQTTSNTIPRTSGRSSGLRQEVTATKTPYLTSEHYNQHTASSDSQFSAQRAVPSNNGFVDHVNSQINSSGKLQTYDHASGSKGVDIQGMEDSLRRILKLDPKGTSGVPSIGRVPPTAVSYVGGRTPL